MKDHEYAAFRLSHSASYPYDAPDNWWRKDPERPAPPAEDWAHAAARGVIADLTDRGGIKHQFDNLDEEVRVDIVTSLTSIIRLAAEQAGKQPLSVKITVPMCLPQDIVDLILAGRGIMDAGLEGEEVRVLDRALEKFAADVPYENEPK